MNVTLQSALALALLIGGVFGAPELGRAEPKSSDPGVASSNNLDGTWSNRSITRLERPAGLLALVVPDADVPALERKLVYSFEHPPGDDIGQFQSEWHDEMHLARIDGKARTSWIISPASGRMPYSAEGARRVEARRGAMMSAFDGPEVRTSSDRCLTPAWGSLGPPMLNAPYAANYVIVQTPDAVAIMSEMNHEVRVIRLAANHDGALLPRWGGDSIGHWEGASLVVDTVGFHPEEVFRSPPYLMSAMAHVTERLTRVSPTELRYGFTIEDPLMFTEAVKGEMPFLASNERVLEYACHEGNYSMRGILAGARKEEADALAKRAKRP